MDCAFTTTDGTCEVCGRAPTVPGVRQNCRGRKVLPRSHGPLVREALKAAGVVPESLGLGDLTAKALESVGITKERWAAWWGAPCGCDERQERLNQVGKKLVAFLKGSTT